MELGKMEGIPEQEKEMAPAAKNQLDAGYESP